jgi:hypothetical protein
MKPIRTNFAGLFKGKSNLSFVERGMKDLVLESLNYVEELGFMKNMKELNGFSFLFFSFHFHLELHPFEIHTRGILLLFLSEIITNKPHSLYSQQLFNLFLNGDCAIYKHINSFVEMFPQNSLIFLFFFSLSF